MYHYSTNHHFSNGEWFTINTKVLVIVIFLEQSKNMRSLRLKKKQHYSDREIIIKSKEFLYFGVKTFYYYILQLSYIE